MTKREMLDRIRLTGLLLSLPDDILEETLRIAREEGIIQDAEKESAGGGEEARSTGGTTACMPILR